VTSAKGLRRGKFPQATRENVDLFCDFEAISGGFKRFQAVFNDQLGVSSLHWTPIFRIGSR
jgi:hypothetical protein